MGKKAEVGTPKYIANKMKAKGLQKLRWFCQMCEKQCRDENGFKCHTMSESHQRQLLLFADNPHRYIDSFSKEFEDGYLDLLSRRFGTRRVHANQVYQEYISFKNHLHMNATRWCTLTGFVMHLGRTGKCVVDETEKGWFVQYIERGPEVIEKQRSKAKKQKMDKDDEELMADFIEQQVERGKDQFLNGESTYTEFKRDNEEEKIVLQVASTSKPDTLDKLEVNPVFLDENEGKIKENGIKIKNGKKEKDERKRKVNALDEIMDEEEKFKERKNRKDYWLTEGIVVKIVTKSLGDKYYKEKCYVKEVIDKYGAIVVTLDAGHKLKLDQAHLETVIPAEGRKVKILNGGYRGCLAILKNVNFKKFSVTAEICSGPLTGRVVQPIPYEDISKLYSS